MLCVPPHVMLPFSQASMMGLEMSGEPQQVTGIYQRDD